MNRNTLYAQWLQWQNYIIIGVLSLVMLFFVPMLGSEVGLAWVLPTTTAGWVVYVLSKLLVAALNIVIFHCFILQAKVNAKDNPQFIEANQILRKYQDIKELAPRSPAKYFAGVYGKKGTTIFITTLLAAVGLTQAVLTFDWVSMLTYLFTILMGLIFGILQMNQTELYWTDEYYIYALNVKQIAEEEARIAEELIQQEMVERNRVALAAEEHLLPRDDTAGTVGGGDVLVSPDNNGDNGTGDIA